MVEVYELREGERIVSMIMYHDDLIIATSHRLFKMWQEWGAVGSKKVHKIEPILMEKADAHSED